ncbi:acetyl/propionyl/methylcrotonyl-CoA carboxylase subunit alpha [Vitreimonas flagellata]|uniref:acetyl/propionyl/methylcrotonyl-CoA carboxylase subunit alpha n=1 Tax=Vitreimonas flagellata TaxID=2560861 RepID=UPI001074DD8C|nr:acetyl/propionyl/methylcrotonyl-CoA carboxylase subunit alpha [Vitreimonas flagellata]
MLKSVLIANRGEIARRVIRTAKRLGVRTVAVYSDADAKSLHVREADDAVHIGPAAAKESYLRGEKIIAAAKQTGAEAIHPGYGFLSENADFAQAVMDAGLIWIGPHPDSIRAMGLKDAAKKLMAEAGVPTTPGYLGEDQSEERLQKEADAIGYPVLIKAVAGGGGKGMRKVEKKGEFKAALQSAKREAAAAFGDDRVLLETYVQRPRHIEVQVFGDTHGQVVHLFERDCSLQRRHQKVIEEAPAPGMSEDARKAVTDAAVLAARAVNYVGAGTIEFIADASEGLRGDRIWFMEMNTRLQVEHPVTEEITGQDLVEWQLRVASGEKLPLKQEELRINGHAIEARLYAEDPSTGFLPSIGRLEICALPDAIDEDVRVDTAVEQSGEVSPHYDPMIAKVIVHAADRAAATAKLADAMGSVAVWPVRTNAGFVCRCLEEAAFAAGDVDTAFIGARGDTLTAVPRPSNDVLSTAATVFHEASAAAASRTQTSQTSPWTQLIGFRSNLPASTRVGVLWKGERFEAEIDEGADASWSLEGDTLVAFENGEAYEFTLDSGERAEGEAAAGDGAILSPMPGKIVTVATKAGAKVKKGDALVVLEAMKMEHTLTAPFDGVVAELKANTGDQVSEGVLLAKLEKQA